MKVFDGADENKTHLGTYCGTKAPEKFRSISSILHIQFSSDGTMQAKGFVMGFSHAPGKIILKSKYGNTVTCKSNGNTLKTSEFDQKKARLRNCRPTNGTKNPEKSTLYLFFFDFFLLKRESEYDQEVPQ